MSTAVWNETSSIHSFAGKALQSAARLWFVVAVGGQLIFALTVAFFYGSTALQGRWALWNRSMSHGYVAGDPVGNGVVVAHLLSAVLLTLFGAVQLWPRVRARAPRLHRWMGRIYIVTAFTASLAGIVMLWGRGAKSDIWQNIPLTIDALLIMFCAEEALRHALARRFEIHRRWTLRLFLAASGVWFFRVGLMFWVAVNHGPAGFDPKTFTGPFLTFLAYADYLIPLAVLEGYLRAQRSRNSTMRLAMATTIALSTAVVGIGIVVATAGMWLPAIRAAAKGFGA